MPKNTKNTKKPEKFEGFKLFQGSLKFVFLNLLTKFYSNNEA